MQRTLTGLLTPGRVLTSCDCVGVIAAAALKCMGGTLQARLYPGSEEKQQDLLTCSLMEHRNTAHICWDSDAGANSHKL